MSSTSGRKERRQFRKLSGFGELAAQEPATEPAAPPVVPPSARPGPAEAGATNSPAGEPPEPFGSERGRKRGGRLWLCLGILGLIVVFIWSIPPIVARPPVLHWLLGMAVEELEGKLTVESASLGWLSPPAVSGVELRDGEGQPLVSVEAAAAERSLASLLWNWADLGTIRLEKPALDVVLRDDGSNLEDLLADLVKPSEEPAKRIGLRLEIVDGTVSITHPRTQKAWRIDQLQLAVGVPAGGQEPIEISGSGVLADARLPGRLVVNLKIEPGGAENTSTAGEGSVQVENLPLEMAGPILARFAPGVQAAGRLSAAVQARFAAAATLENLQLDGTAAVDDFSAAAPALAGDRPRLRRIETDCRLAYAGRVLQVTDMAVRTDLGRATLSGTLELGDAGLADLAARLPRQAFDLEAEVDLARLAGLLPETLRIREGTEIASGRLAVSARGRPEPDRVAWSGRIAATGVTATAGGRRIHWQQPILVTLAAYQNAEGPFVETLKCESDFLKLDGSGTPDDMKAQASFALDRLADQLGQFVDLGGLRLEGDGWLRLAWRRDAQRRFQTEGELQLTNFHFAVGERRPWVEPSLAATFTAVGQTDFASQYRLDAATLEATAGDDPPERIEARLTQPVPDLRQPSWAVEISSQGRLDRWLPRLSPWVDLDAWQAGGSYELSGEAAGSGESVAVSRLLLAVRELAIRGEKLDVSQPKVEVTAAGSWDRAARRLVLNSAEVTADSVSAKASDVVAAFGPEDAAELGGTVELQGNLGELSGWIVDPAAPPPWRLAGRLDGSAQFQQSGEQIAGTLQAAVRDLVVAHKDGQRFQEKEVQLFGRGAYHTTAQALQLEEIVLVSAAVSVKGAGRLSGSGQNAQAEVGGSVEYDLEQLSGLARSYLGDGIYLAGRGSSPVRFRGPLSLDGAEAGAAVKWTWGDVYGFRLGPGELEAALAEGVAQVRPADLAVSEGNVRVAAQARLSPQPVELFVPPGPLVQNVRINPQMCAHALQYIAPVLSGVATAEGRFSIELDGCRIPLADPSAGELAGRMIIHSAQVGPGPLVRELSLALGYSSPAQIANQSTIDFRMVDGRVYHRGVVVQFPDLAVRTYGWVGLDKSLGLMAEMPVPPKWIGSSRTVAAALRDQTIQVPIGGTLERPKVDQQALRQVSRQFLEKAAANVVEDQLLRGLDRLLKPPQ